MVGVVVVVVVAAQVVIGKMKMMMVLMMLIDDNCDALLPFGLPSTGRVGGETTRRQTKRKNICM